MSWRCIQKQINVSTATLLLSRLHKGHLYHLKQRQSVPIGLISDLGHLYHLKLRQSVQIDLISEPINILDTSNWHNRKFILGLQPCTKINCYSQTIIFITKLDNNLAKLKTRLGLNFALQKYHWLLYYEHYWQSGCFLCLLLMHIMIHLVVS